MNKERIVLYSFTAIAFLSLFLGVLGRLISQDNPPSVKEKSKKEKEEEEDKAIPLAKKENPVIEFKGKVKFIPDGDTIHLMDGSKIRLIGINCPEIYHDQKLAQSNAFEASEFLKSLTVDKEIIIKYTENNKLDQFERILGNVYVDKKWVNYEMVKNGLAFIFVNIDSDDTNILMAAQKEAQKNKVGIWKGEPSPELFTKFLPKFESGELADYVDKTILIVGLIEKYQKNKGAVLLSIKLSNNSIIQASISKNNFLHFPDLSKEKFLNKNISLIGKVNLYNDKLEISIRYPTQILMQ